MILRKLSVIFLSVFVLFACSTPKMLKADKFKIMPGVSTSTPYFKYIIEVKIPVKTKFTAIQVDGKKNIESFAVTNMATNRQSDNSTWYEKGSYLLQFEMDHSDEMEAKNQLIQLTTTDAKEKKKIVTMTTSPLKTIRLR